MNQGSTANVPEKKFSTGAISATIWRNNAKDPKGQPVTYNSVSLQRRYKDKNDAWQSTNSLRVNDLPKASLVLQKSYEYLVLRGMSQGDDLVEEVI